MPSLPGSYQSGLHLCVPLLPGHEDIQKNRSEQVSTALQFLQDGIAKQDEELFNRGYKRLDTLLENLVVLTTQETAAFLQPLCEVGLQTSWKWASIHMSIRSMRIAGRLLSGKNLALIPHVQDILHWRRLYETCIALHGFVEKTETRAASDEVLRDHADRLGWFIRRAKHYQRPGTAKEVADFFEQMIVTKDRESDRMQEALVYLYLFYPGEMVNDDPDPQARLETWVEAWGQVDISAEWDAAWFALIKRLHKARKVDLTPYLSRLFGRAHFSLRLGGAMNFDSLVSQRYVSPWQYFLSKTAGSIKASKLIVDILHVGDAIKRLEHMLMTVRTFIHPSNQGSHADRLVGMIQQLCDSFAKRTGRETRLPERTLTRDIQVRFIEAVMPLVIMGLNSKSLSVINSSQSALRHLAWVAPTTIAKKTLDDVVSTGLDPSNTRSHQTAAALKALTVTIQPLIYGGSVARSLIVPHLANLLSLSLPGLDPNDTRKTVVTMIMTYAVLSNVPLVNTAGLVRERKLQPPKQNTSYGIDAEEANVVMDDNGETVVADDLFALGPLLAEWGLGYIRRFFVLAQARGARAKKGVAAQMDLILDYFYAETAVLCLSQMDSLTRETAMKEIASFLIEDVVLPDAQTEAYALARACTRSDPDMAIKILLPGLLAMVDEKSDSRRISWALVSLGGLIRFAGKALLPFADDIESRIKRSFKHKDAKVRKLGEKLIRRYVRALLDTYLIRDVAVEDAQLIRDAEGTWGNFDGDWSTISVQWHISSEPETTRAQSFLVQLTSDALRGILEGEVDRENFHPEVSERQRLHHRLSVLHQSIRGSLTHLDNPSFGILQRAVLIDRMVEVARKLQPTTDTDALKLCIKCLSLLGSAAQGPRGAGNGDYIRAFAMWSAWLRDVSQSRAYESEILTQARLDFLATGKGTGSVTEPEDRIEPRRVMQRYVEILQRKRTLYASFDLAQRIRGIEELEAPFKKAGDMLQSLCFHPFSAVRIAAQRHRAYVDSRFPWHARTRLVEDTLPRLGVVSAGKPENFTGALYICGSDSSMAKITRRWPVFKRFFEVVVLESRKAIDQLPDHRRGKAEERLAKLLHVVLQRWFQFPKATVPKGEIGGLLSLLASAGNDPAVHWRRKITLCAAIGILSDPMVEPEIPREAVSFVVSAAREDILPLRTVALSVIRKLMLCGEDISILLASELYRNDNAADFWLRAGTTLAEDRMSAAADDQRADWSVGVGEFIKIGRGLVKRPRFPKSRYDSFAPKDFHSPKTDIWVGLCSLLTISKPLQTALDEVVLPTLKKLAFEGESNKDRMIRRMAASELFGGCLAVKPEWTAAFFPVLTRMLAELSNAATWCDAVLYAASFSSERGDALLELLNRESDKISLLVASPESKMDEPETDMEREKGYSYTSNLLKVTWGLLTARGQPVPVHIAAKFERALLHPYKQVRQSAGTALGGFVIVKIYPLEQAREALLNVCKKGGKEGLEAALDFLAVVCAMGDAKRLLDPLVIPLIGPALFQAQGHEDLMLANVAKTVLNLVASMRCMAVPELAVKLETTICSEFSTHPEWPKRRALAQFLRIFHALHACLLLGMGAGALVQKTSEDLLLDSQAEVRDAARQLLLGLLAAANPASLTSARDRYFKMIARPDPVKKRQGILALTALVEAAPYSIPEALPLSVLELSRHVNGPNGDAAKKTLSEFRRTHIDEWAEHKKAFTEEQLNALEGVLVSPDYYA